MRRRNVSNRKSILAENLLLAYIFTQWLVDEMQERSPKKEPLILYKEGFLYRDSYTKTELKRCLSEERHPFPVLMIKVQSLVPA